MPSPLNGTIGNGNKSCGWGTLKAVIGLVPPSRYAMHRSLWVPGGRAEPFFFLVGHAGRRVCPERQNPLSIATLRLVLAGRLLRQLPLPLLRIVAGLCVGIAIDFIGMGVTRNCTDTRTYATGLTYDHGRVGQKGRGLPPLLAAGAGPALASWPACHERLQLSYQVTRGLLST